VSFTAIWLLFSPSLGIWGVSALCVFTSLMIAASGIDIDHMIIPDSITLQGLCLGLIFSTIVPQLHNEFTWYNGLFSALVGVTVGFALFSGIVLLGKLLFGRMTHEYAEPTEFHISQPGGQDDAIFIQLGRDQYQWHYVFFRRWDKLKMKVTELSFNDIPQVVQKKFHMVPDGFVIDGHKTELSSVRSVTGKFTRAVVPREVVGYGNVKYVAMIGAFVGWQAVAVTTVTAFGIVFLLRNIFKGNVISFSPFLALGAFIFLLFKFL
jgi:leader peptidase (prepilin peptidase)/N-methyltransferase